jgi:hypothetical protein
MTAPVNRQNVRLRRAAPDRRPPRIGSGASIGRLGAKDKSERKTKMKRGLLIAAAVLTLAGAARAGEINSHAWPCAFAPQELLTIPVTIDLGYWIRVKSQTRYVIKMSQIDIHTYQGCITIPVECNGNTTVSCWINKLATSGDMSGVFSCSVDPTSIGPGRAEISVCAKATDVNLGAMVGGAMDVPVAVVTLRFVSTV